MYERKVIYAKSPFDIVLLEEGESIEEKCRRVTTTNEPIDETAPMIYTEKSKGVMPQYDIRTDRWEIAQSAMDTYNKSLIAQRNSEVDDNVPATPRGEQQTEPKQEA